MNYLYTENLSKAYGEKILFENISLSINKGQKVALIARNGAGKSSLLRIVAGIDTPDSGSCSLHPNIRVGYLPQEPEFAPQLSVWDAIYQSDNPILSILRQYENCLLQQKINPQPQLNEQITRLMTQIDSLNAWDYENRIKEILSKLELDQLHEQRIGELSGGQRKRVALAALLVHEPDLMILDEPTNHLDILMIEWLEKYLQQPNLTLLLVTHDRYFLDAVTNEIVELHKGDLYKFKGNYAYYLEKRAELDYNLSNEVDSARRLMRKELDWMRRQPKARGTKAKARISSFYDLQDVATQNLQKQEVQFSINIPRLGSKIIELHSVYKKYPSANILENFSYKFNRFDRVGIAGKNGVGKTTFINLITGLEQADSGTIKWGETLKIGYFKQHAELDEDKRVIETIREIAEYIELEKGHKLTAVQLLNHFLFPTPLHYAYVHKLSGGEKRRLHLLTVLMQNPNFLILDEPTNDLDIDTLNLLEEFLTDFKGCLVVISHDRYFMDKLVNHLFVFEGNAHVRDFPGNYTDYRNALDEEAEAAAQAKNTQTVEKPTPNVEKTQRSKQKLSYKEQQEFQQIEKDLPALEHEKEQLSELLQNPEADSQQLMEWGNRIAEVVRLIDEKESRWLELSEYL
ncbi:MAG: ABC-F family ATP-binding cassette domain-containing protein [Chitinophagales bacterium]|nr:ABC-F family ATP-binding cassette domain-containing protein [Bacteroidota bacterium]MCB9043968.1 ABC-F family ATP-binding cassette domain-containing protein [Chitinophagales bacterium]